MNVGHLSHRNCPNFSKGVKVLKNMRYIFSVLLVVCLLFSATPVGDGFIVATHGLQLEGLQLLILKVHEPEWKIAYRYGVDCKPEDRQNDEALKEAISSSLRVWLAPLKGLNPERPIVDKFVYELQPDYDPNQPSDNLEGWRAVDLRVGFECTQGTSKAGIGRLYPPDLRMKRGTKVTPNTHYSLTHELGHAFGLADTYQRPGFMRSRGGLDWTAGNQPASVMAMAGDPGDTLIDINEDDKRGIVWLYKYFYEDLASDDCFFADYVFEEEPRGCIPKYPLIFETKHNLPMFALELIKQDPTINVNAQDVGGMTALHYAVMYEKAEVVKALLDHEDIKPFLKSKEGQTPLDIALATNNSAIIEMFPEPPPRKEDVNRDGVVNILDLVAVAGKFGEKDAGNADVNGDGTVNIQDLVLVAGAFG